MVPAGPTAAHRKDVRRDRRVPKARRDRSALRELDDRDLFGEIGQGCRAAFDVLYNRYFSLIYAFTQQRVHNHADAEELTQETFVAVFRSAQGYAGKPAPLAWIYAIAKNTTYNRLRRQKRRADRIEEVGVDVLTGLAGAGPDDPETKLAYQRYFDSSDGRLQSLRPWQAEVFILRYVHELPIREIAERLDRSSDAVRSSLYRMKRALNASHDPRDGTRLNV